jgi:NAD(P)H-flavin reductase
MEPRPFRIGRIRRETHDTFTLELKPADGRGPCPFAAGQFNMVYVYGIGESAISISGDPANTGVLVHTTRAVGSVTKAKVLAQREKFGRVVLLYGTRTPADVLYKTELNRWGGKFDLEVYVTVDRATANWRGNVGVVTSLIRRAPFDPVNTTAMVCGPEIMMRYTVQELEGRGVKPPGIYLSMERNMKCAVGLCGHCQWGPKFICKDGPVFRFDRVRDLFNAWEI